MRCEDGVTQLRERRSVGVLLWFDLCKLRSGCVPGCQAGGVGLTNLGRGITTRCQHPGRRAIAEK